jgi:hypothetical protein
MNCVRGARTAATMAVLLGLGPASSVFACPLSPITVQAQPQPQAQSQGTVESSAKAQEKTARGDHPQPESGAPSSAPSLGDLARQARTERSKGANSGAPLFTNDNLPKASGGLSIIGSPSGEENPTAGTEDKNHAATRLRRQVADLRERLETHQRELNVLQQRVGQNEVQYYPNPNDILHQEYSRGDINRLTAAIDQKKQQVDADQRALADAEDELARLGLAPLAPEAAPETSGVPRKPDLSGLKKGSEEYWKARFKAAREALARAQQEQKLAEDELALLQSQQAHEIASGGAAAFDSQIAGKQNEVESKRAAADQAQRDLDALEQEFKASGSPQAWSEPSN